MRVRTIISAMALLMLGGPLASRAAELQNVNRPDILILDFASQSGIETINLTYPATVPHAQVKRDIAALETSLGTQFHSVQIEDAPPPFPGEKNKMTSASFQATHALANTPNTVAVEPLILALRPYKHLTVHYLVDSSYKFEGLRDYQDKFVTIAFTPATSTYSYDIHINDPGFTKLNLPMYVPDPATVQVTAAPTTPPTTPAHKGPWIIVAIAVVALALGGVVYSVLTRYF